MGKDKSSWNDIPTLEGLKVEWEYEPENSLGRRAYTRLTMTDLAPIVRKKDIPVKLVTQSGQHLTYMVDISQGGVCLKTKTADLQESQLAKIGFILGNQKVITNGRIKYVRTEKGWFILGLEFVGLSGDDYDYIAGLYSSLTLKDSWL